MSFFSFLDDPAAQALLAGGAIAATGGAAAPALGAAAPALGAGGSYAAGALGTAGGFGGLGGATVMPGASGGLLGGMSGLARAVKPYGDAAGAAMMVKGLLSDPQQPTAPAQSSAPQMNNGQGAQSLAQLYQQGAQMSPEEQARLQRKTMWG